MFKLSLSFLNFWWNLKKKNKKDSLKIFILIITKYLWQTIMDLMANLQYNCNYNEKMQL